MERVLDLELVEMDGFETQLHDSIAVTVDKS